MSALLEATARASHASEGVRSVGVLETFFEKFELFAEAPDAVAKMRELVLEFATRGWLSERRNTDETEPVWQAFVEEFDKRIDDNDLGPPLPFEVPKAWRWVCVDDVASACGQKKPDEPFTYIDVASIDNQRGTIKPELEVLRPENAPSRARKLVRRGTVIYATVRPYLRNIAVIDREFSPPVIVSTAFAILHPRPFVDGQFLFHWLRSKSFEAEVAERMKGVAYPAINDGEFRGCPIPLPPLAEQKRIVAKVDELMVLCDRLEAQQQERETRHAALARASLARFAEAPTPANLDFLFHRSYAISPADLRKSILTLAVQGKLVPQDPNDEPAAASFPGLGSIIPESNNRARVPNGWALFTYRSLTSLVTSGSRGWKNFYSSSGAIFVRTQNIKTDKFVLDDVAFVDLPKSAEGMRAEILKDDIMITITGANVTKAARVEEQIPEAYVSQHIALTRPRWPAMSPWLHLCFISHGSARGVLEKLAYGDKPGLNLNNIRDLMIPVPPLAEQRRIVAKVNELMALVDALETQLAAARTTAEKLLTAAVAELTGSVAPDVRRGRVAETLAPV